MVQRCKEGSRNCPVGTVHSGTGHVHICTHLHTSVHICTDGARFMNNLDYLWKSGSESKILFVLGRTPEPDVLQAVHNTGLKQGLKAVARGPLVAHVTPSCGLHVNMKKYDAVWSLK